MLPVSITEKILSSNRFHTDIYLQNTINLTKSIIISNPAENKLYNEYISLNYPNIQIDQVNTLTNRYYFHLASKYHTVDTPMSITSIDNGQTIVLSKESLQLHKHTHSELLKYSLLYKTTVNKYPEQELLLRSIINTSPTLTHTPLNKLPSFTIVSYNQDLIEPNEQDLIQDLQLLINNYKVTKLIPYYSLTDSLFLASQYQILYNFILTSLLSLRLKNVKTPKAHSYHILNYLASHHYLDTHYENLTKDQALFLYRNLLYLNNHSGRNHTFNTLINQLFTKRSIAITNYVYNQSNTLNEDNSVNYSFNQRLLNTSELPIDYKDFTLNELLTKEHSLAKSNQIAHRHELTSIERPFINSLYSTHLTKNLEALIVDTTDIVRDKLIPTMINHWVYLIKTNRLEYITSVSDPVTNIQFKLQALDTFKLFVLTLFKLNKIELTYFPDFTITKIFREPLPTASSLYSKFYLKKHYHLRDITDILNHTPVFRHIPTSSEFSTYITNVYRYYIALWLFTSNTHDLHDEGQYSNTINNIHTIDAFSFNAETPQAFLHRLGIPNLYSYSNNSLETLYLNILNGISNNKISFLFRNKHILNSMKEIFKQFISYSVQLIDNYHLLTAILTGHKDLRTSISDEVNSSLYLPTLTTLYIDPYTTDKYKSNVYFSTEVEPSVTCNSRYDIQLSPTVNGKVTHIKYIDIFLSNRIINSLEDDRWLVFESDEDQLHFLAST